MFAKLKADLSAILERDPAAGGSISAILLYPSFHVMLAYRLAHPLWQVGLHTLSRFIMQTARWLTGIEIHPAAEIGEGFFADHGVGIVIGQTAILGRNVTLYHGVTLGGVMPAVDSKAQRLVKRHPTLKDGVIVGAGAQILGPVTVGARARVGGNSVVTKDVGEGQTVVGIPAKPLQKRPADGQFEPYAVSHMPSEDSQARTLSALFAELESLRKQVEMLRDLKPHKHAPVSKSDDKTDTPTSSSE